MKPLKVSFCIIGIIITHSYTFCVLLKTLNRFCCIFKVFFFFNINYFIFLFIFMTGRIFVFKCSYWIFEFIYLYVSK